VWHRARRYHRTTEEFLRIAQAETATLSCFRIFFTRSGILRRAGGDGRSDTRRRFFAVLDPSVKKTCTAFAIERFFRVQVVLSILGVFNAGHFWHGSSSMRRISRDSIFVMNRRVSSPKIKPTAVMYWMQ
jgi:hypothetical protein